MDVLMPQLGETVSEGKITTWFKTIGDPVRPGDNLFEIETDKVTMEVPAIDGGVLAEIRVPAGDSAPVGAVVAVIADKAGAAAVAPRPTQSSDPSLPLPVRVGVSGDSLSRDQTTPSGALRAPPTPHGGEADKLDPFREVRSPARNFGPARLAGGVAVTPLARRLASEAGIDLTKVTGSGPRGRIVARDLDAAPKPLTQAQAALPVTLTADVMIGQPLALCAEASGVELSDIVVKAWGATLARAMPGKSSDIALLTASGRRVIRDAASKPLSVLAKLRADGTPATGSENAASAISIPGVPGIASVADILRPPHTTLLSVAAPRRAPVEGEDGSVRFTDMMTVTLACDPQAGDAAGAAQLLAAFKAYVERPVMMLV